MVKIYLPDKSALGYFGHSATSQFWDTHWRGDEIRRRITAGGSGYFLWFVKKYLSPSSGPILEGGCGLAQLVFSLTKMGYQATGIDFAEQTVARVNAAAPELDVRCGDVRSLPFGDDTFAGYLSLGVIEHFWNGYGPILSEMRRVVRPGGYVFLSVPCMSLLRRAKAAAGMYPTTLPENPEKDFYQFALDRHRVLREVKRAGFHPVEVHRFGGIKGFKDEVRFGRNWLQRLHDGKTRFRFKNALDNQLARFANHMMFVVMRNTHKTRKRSKS